MDNMAFCKETQVSITKEDWFEISRALESFHGVFYKAWQIGKPVFTQEIETACIKFDKNGNFLLFCFNPNFWMDLNFENKLFVICHEILHVILNHGKRSKGVSKGSTVANICLDIVVNHSLVRNFGFVKTDLKNWDKYCWVETIFPDQNVSSDETFEFYYNLFDKFFGDGLPGDGEKETFKTVDEHQGFSEEDSSKVIEKLNSSLSDEEKESLKSVLDKFSEDEQKEAGKAIGSWKFKNHKSVLPKRKWESVIKKWTHKNLNKEEKQVEQWTRLNRRLCLMNPSLFLPSDADLDSLNRTKNKVKVWFFLDSSGSCANLSERFFKAAGSLSKTRFEVRLFCFDTQVFEVKLEDNLVYGGGGTCFKILEQKILSETVYPEAIFVITDGYGTNIKPKYPKRWHWFITERGTKQLIDPSCNFYELKDFC